MNNNYFLVVRLGNMKERVRASKILKFLDKQNTVTLVKKASSEDIDLKIQYVNLIHEHNSKLIEYFLWVTKLFF